MINKKNKIRRNDPCPCGSGKKFKKCCLGKKSENKEPQSSFKKLPEDIKMKILRHQTEEKARKDKFGEVRPIIHADFKGYKFVAVGNQLIYSQNWKTFPDFLLTYIGTALGPDWGNSELKKPFEQRHPIANWYVGMCHFQAKQKRGADGIFDAIPDGNMAAYLRLAYDLYVIKDNVAFQNGIIERLKIKDQFQGARYELFATATCIRAGFKILYEDESDRSKKHTEFMAIHKETGQKIYVEAKSRRRPGVLGFPGDITDISEYKARVRRMLNKALQKPASEPYVIFIDLNLPPAPGKIFNKPWFQEVWESIYEDGGPTYERPDPYNLVILTNHPEHYGEEGEPVPSGDFFSVFSKLPKIKPKHSKAIIAVLDAAEKYRNIPNEFPEDWND